MTNPNQRRLFSLPVTTDRVSLPTVDGLGGRGETVVETSGGSFSFLTVTVVTVTVVTVTVLTVRVVTMTVVVKLVP